MRNARRIRQQLGLTIEDVAGRTTIKFSHIGAFERGLVGMGIGRLQELAAYYGCTIDDLVAEIPAEETVAVGGIGVVVTDASSD